MNRHGMPVFQSEGLFLACVQQSDRLADRSVGCASWGEHIAWHNYLSDALHGTGDSAHLASLKEKRALLTCTHGDRPAMCSYLTLHLVVVIWRLMYA